MSQYKKEITIAMSIAVIGVILLAAAASYLASSQQIGPTGTRSTCCTTTTSSPGNYGYLAAVVLKSPNVESQAVNAYYVSILSQRQNPANASQLFVEVFVVKTQSVSGNWRTAYDVNYTGRELLNVTVGANLLALQSSYNVEKVSTTSLPDTSSRMTFTSDQQHAIQVALANSSLSNLLSSTSYYVWNVDTTINGGAITGYQVQINQVNGNQAFLAIVDPGLTHVQSVAVFSHSPWGPFLQP